MTQQENERFEVKFTLKAIFVSMIVFSVAAMTIGYLVRSINDPVQLGYFVVMTSMAPLAVMVVTSWMFRLFRNYFR